MRRLSRLAIVVFLLMLGAIIHLLITSWDNKIITDADVLSAIVNIVASVIGFMTAFYIFDLGDKTGKHKEDNYNKDMLSLLLVYTVIETEQLASNILSVTVSCRDAKSRSIYLPNDFKNVDQGYTLVGIAPDIREFDYPIKQKMVREFLENRNLSELVYCDNWYEYLKSINDSKDRKHIVDWVLTLRSRNIKSYNLMTNRDEVIELLRRATWVNLDIGSLKTTVDLYDDYKEECEKYGLEYDVVFT